MHTLIAIALAAIGIAVSSCLPDPSTPPESPPPIMQVSPPPPAAEVQWRACEANGARCDLPVQPSTPSVDDEAEPAPRVPSLLFRHVPTLHGPRVEPAPRRSPPVRAALVS